jgi:hypothetical protein
MLLEPFELFRSWHLRLRLRVVAQADAEHVLERAEPVTRLAPVVFPVADSADRRANRLR